MSFSLETTLDTKVPKVIEFLGPPSSAVQHEITGTILMRVQKAVVIKQLEVVFNAEANANYRLNLTNVRTDTICLHRVENNLLNAPVQYQPGEHTFPFRLSLPGDLATTDAQRLKSDAFLWAYELVTSCVPSGLFSRRKVIRQPLTLRRVHVPPSDTSSVRYGAKRAGEFECSLYLPKYVTSQESKMGLRAFLHPLSRSHKVKEILAQAIQSEKLNFDVEAALRAQPNTPPQMINYQINECPPVIVDVAKSISEVFTIPNPDQEECATEWGREIPIEFEISLEMQDILPSEKLEWLKVSHGIRFTMVFADSTIRPLVVMAPFQVVDIIDGLWTTPPPEGLTPPDYSLGDDHSTLLDSNTSRMARQQLQSQLYPEREPVVPDLADDLPPVYDYEQERPTRYSEKIYS
ncbi:hypothetical protein BGX27_009917 [Mortierella sp. AM989]|nr:hypothetical protein BGX27_009917 [Mortierella sp. AM989]